MKLLARAMCTIVGVIALTALFGTGTSSAKDPLVGSTFADASAKIAKWHAKPVISTVTGALLSTDDCIVTNWQKAGFLDASGKKRGGTILVDLNCNSKVALPGKPGNSVATAEGKAAKAIHTRATFINSHPEWCEKSDKNMTNCVKFCARNAGMCKIDYS